MWYWGNGVHWWGWLIGLLTTAAFFGIVVWGIWFVVTGLARPREHGVTPERLGPPDDRARRILDERLARGEIGEDEYRRLRDLLHGRDAPHGPGPSPSPPGPSVPTGTAGR